MTIQTFNLNNVSSYSCGLSLFIVSFLFIYFIKSKVFLKSRILDQQCNFKNYSEAEVSRKSSGFIDWFCYLLAV